MGHNKREKIKFVLSRKGLAKKCKSELKMFSVNLAFSCISKSIIAGKKIPFKYINKTDAKKKADR